MHIPSLTFSEYVQLQTTRPLTLYKRQTSLPCLKTLQYCSRIVQSINLFNMRTSQVDFNSKKMRKSTQRKSREYGAFYGIFSPKNRCEECAAVNVRKVQGVTFECFGGKNSFNIEECQYRFGL